MTQDRISRNRSNFITYAAFAAMGFFLLLLDQVTKIWAVQNFDGVVQPVLPFFNLVLVWNPGISFGIFQNHDGVAGPWVLTGLALLIVSLLIFWLVRTPRRRQQWALLTVIAGALGNVIDRILYGAVVDFLDFHLFGYHWPAFNVADICVVAGIAFLVIDSLFFEPRDKPSGNE